MDLEPWRSSNKPWGKGCLSMINSFIFYQNQKPPPLLYTEQKGQLIWDRGRNRLKGFRLRCLLRSTLFLSNYTFHDFLLHFCMDGAQGHLPQKLKNLSHSLSHFHTSFIIWTTGQFNPHRPGEKRVSRKKKPQKTAWDKHARVRHRR